PPTRHSVLFSLPLPAPPLLHTLSLHDALPISISRLSPALALIIAWTAAVLQMAAGLWPLPLNIAVFVVLFAAAAWGSRRLLWLRSEEHTSELQSRENLVCRLLLEKKKYTARY